MFHCEIQEKLYVCEAKIETMQHLTLFSSAVIFTAIIMSACGDSSPKEVEIGNQVWMGENLNVEKFCNGDPIPEAKTEVEWKAYVESEEAAWCYYENDPKNGEKYGKLYNWYAVNDPRGLAPKGWHIPTKNEWAVLIDYLGGEEKAGAKLKSKEGWSEGGNGTNSSNFSGLPSGMRHSNGQFGDIGYWGVWWSASEANDINMSRSFASCHSLFFSNGNASKYLGGKKSGYSVRCIKD